MCIRDSSYTGQEHGGLHDINLKISDGECVLFLSLIHISMPEDSGASRHCAYLVVDGVNPGLTDLFTRQARKAMQEPQKSSVLQKLRQEPPARKPAAPKKQEPER